MPYRIDADHVGADAGDRLIDLGALDVELRDRTVAAILPDSVSTTEAARALGVPAHALRRSPAVGRDDGSVWILEPRATQAGRLRIQPEHTSPAPGVLRLVDSSAFGTGLHPTTVLCLEALHDEIEHSRPDAVLDVGTGSGILALAALHAGVPRVVAVDIAPEAVAAAARNARANSVSTRLRLIQGGPDAIAGSWPLVLANVTTASLIDMGPTLCRLVGRGGRLVLSGVRESLASDVARTYRHLAMHQVNVRTRAGWTALTLQASW